MKNKIFFSFGVLFLFAQCALQVEYIPERVDYYVTDFDKHNEEDFFITTEPPKGDYQPVGIVQVEISAKAALIKMKNGIDGNGLAVFNEVWLVDTYGTTQTALDSLVDLSRTLGADALTNYESSVRVTYPLPNQINSPAIPVISVSGFAVKRGTF